MAAATLEIEPTQHVWTDSRKESRNQPHYCLFQRLDWNRSEWKVVSRLSGQTPAAVCIGFESLQWTKRI